MKKRCNIMLRLLAVWMAALLFLPAALAETVTSGSVQFTVADYGFLAGLQAVVPTAGHQFLSVNMTMKTAADAPEITGPEQYFLAVDELGRVYAPMLYNGSSSFTSSLAPGEKNLRLLFEVPNTAAVYRLAVLDEPGGSVAGLMNLGKSSGAVPANDAQPLYVLPAEGYELAVYGVTQSRAAFLDKAPAGMKYVWVDAALTGTGTEKTAAQLAAVLTVSGGEKAVGGVVPTRAGSLLALANVKLGGQLPAARGYVCYLVPESLSELSGLTDGKAVLPQALPIAGELKEAGFAQLDADGAYHQAGWRVTIHGMRLADKGVLNPPAGSKYVIVNLTVSNRSTQNLTVSSELAFAMTDAQGNELTQAWFADLADTLDKTLLPSESVSGEIAFLLPDGVKPGVMRVHLNMLGEPLLIDASSYLAE